MGASLLRMLFVAAIADIGLLAVQALAAELSHAQLRALAVEAVRDGDVAFSPPSEKVVGRLLWVKDAGPAADDPDGLTLDYWFDAGDPLKAVFLDQLAIEIRRRHLFVRSRQQHLIEQYYRRMEEIVAAELAMVQQSGDEEQKQRQLDERLQQLGDLLQAGIEACARDLGLAGAFVEPGHDDGTVWLDRLFTIYLPQQGQLTFGQVELAVDQAIRDRAVTFDMPAAVVETGALRVIDVGLRVELMRKLEPIEEVAAELVKIDLRRRHLFQRSGNRAIMEPVYGQMEQAVRRQLETLRQAGAASADAPRQVANALPDDDGPIARSAFGRELDGLLNQGLQRCARSMGNVRLELSSARGADAAVAVAKVRLVAPTGTTIEFVHNTDRKLWALAGKREVDYPWQRYTAGDAVYLLGGYWFRLTYPDGRHMSVYKKVGTSDTELRFPSR